ncbi:MAG: hypothetical protein Q4D26_11480 [Clostridia bacterium]|nr:hypothetical protein [Clostridia bacterium]
MVSNINEIVNSYNFSHNAFVICGIIFIFSFIFAHILSSANEESLAKATFFISLISLLATILTLFGISSTQKDNFCKIDNKINAIVEENISMDEKKEKVITYLETEKFYDRISGYENYNNNFKVTYAEDEHTYEFTITESD